jgi:activator of 2-hydroxyglutaryl-CoA dehydratase
MEKIFMGLDIGSISAKAVGMTASGRVLFKESRRVHGRPAQAAAELLKNAKAIVSNVIVTGSGAAALKGQGYKAIGEFKAIVKAVSALDPDVRTIFEMGGETSKFVRINISNGSPFSHLWSVESHSRGVKTVAKLATITEYGMNGDCAAGTGSFIDQQAERLHYGIEEIGPLVCKADRCARVAQERQA